MKFRDTALLAGLLVGAIGIGSATTPFVSAADPSPSGGEIKRYQMELKYAPNSSDTTIFICDTTTGQVWYTSSTDEKRRWTDLGTPPAGAPAK